MIYAGRFAGRTAVITGGASGLGLEAAKAHHPGRRQGLPVGPQCRHAGSARKQTGAAHMIALDVSDPKAVEAAANESRKVLGKVDILINSAGITGATHTVIDYPINSWLKVMDVNVNGLFYCCRFIAPMMVENWLMAASSTSPRWPARRAIRTPAPIPPPRPPCWASQSPWARNWRPKGVIVNAVTPATFESPILKGVPQSHIDYMRSKIPMDRLGTAPEIAAAVCWLASEECSFTTASTLDTSGGRNDLLRRRYFPAFTRGGFLLKSTAMSLPCQEKKNSTMPSSAWLNP